MTQIVNAIGGAPISTPDPITATDDTVHVLTSAHYQKSEGHVCRYLTVVVENAPIRVRFGADPVAGSKGVMIEPGAAIKLDNLAQLKAFGWCNGIAGANATVQYFPEY